jgi:hypothetical protein
LGNAALTNLDVRVSGNAVQAVGAIREAIRKSEPALLVNEVSVMERRIERDLSRERVVAYLAFSFGALTLLLASLGLYGVLSYGVMRRTAEIGVRMALGAQRGQVVRWVIGESAQLMAVGSAAGLIATALGARYLSGLLFGVTPLDSISLVAVMITFAVVMTLASYLPVAARFGSIQFARCVRSDRSSFQVRNDFFGQSRLHRLRLIDREPVNMYFEVRVALFHSEGRRDSSDRVEDGVIANAGGRCLTKGGALRGRLGEVECLRVLQGQNDGRTLTGTPSRSGPSADLARRFPCIDTDPKRGADLSLCEQRAWVGRCRERGTRNSVNKCEGGRERKNG